MIRVHEQAQVPTTAGVGRPGVWTTMTCDLDAVCLAALDPARVATFWAELLGRRRVDGPGGGVELRPDDDTGFGLRVVPTREPKTHPNRAHLDLTSSSLAAQQQTVARALALGGRHVDVGQRPEEEHVVLGDLEGNEFCVVEPGNAFLADCGFVGALACDGSQAVGYFWSAALGWPLVWDRDEETAIRSPRGGAIISWGGPPFRPPPDRLQLDLVPAADSDQRTEVDRLVALGATRLDTLDDGRVLLADPDGNPFSLGPGGGNP